MLRFYASTYTAVVVNLARAKEFLLAYPDMENVRSDLFVFLAHVYNELLEVPTSSVIRQQARRVMELPDDADTTMLYTMVTELQHNMNEELTSHVFLCIPDREAVLWRDPLRWFGKEAVAAFPAARGDMRDCARCLALRQWTASVYHSMCVVQYGLHKLAGLVGARFTREIDVLNWNDILREIHLRLKAIADNEPKTAERDAKLKLGGDAAAHFFAIKEAWRNHVMHGRDRYDEHDAWPIVDAVRAIMRALA